MGYNKFRWWTNGRKKKLSVKKPLIERINNGDFDYSHYYSEEKAARKQSSDLYNEIMSKCPDGGDYWGYEYEIVLKKNSRKSLGFVFGIKL